MARQELKDRFGHKIGEIRDEGNRQVIYDRFDHKKDLLTEPILMMLLDIESEVEIY